MLPSEVERTRAPRAKHMSALEQSVTLEDVFSVVNAKRVPLAPELAGYLTLEIAEGSQGSEGDVDPKTVFIGEEGSVALVRPKRDSVGGSAEGSVRAIKPSISHGVSTYAAQ